MNILEAIEGMKEGKLFTREVWEDKYIWWMPEANIPAEWCREPHLKQLAENNGGTVLCGPAIRCKDENDIVTTGYWLSPDDLAANDWMELILS